MEQRSNIENFFHCPSRINQIAELPMEGWHRVAKVVLSPYGLCTCVTTQSNNLLQKILIIEEDTNE